MTEGSYFDVPSIRRTFEISKGIVAQSLPISIRAWFAKRTGALSAILEEAMIKNSSITYFQTSTLNADVFEPRRCNLSHVISDGYRRPRANRSQHTRNTVLWATRLLDI